MVLPALLGEVVRDLGTLSSVAAIFLVGSRADGVGVDEHSDWNLLVFVDGSLSPRFGQEILAPRCSFWLHDESAPGSAEGLLNDGTRWTISFRSLNEPSVTQVQAPILFERLGLDSVLSKRSLDSVAAERRKDRIVALWLRIDEESSRAIAIQTGIKRGDRLAAANAVSNWMDAVMELVFAVNGQPFIAGRQAMRRVAKLPSLPDRWASHVETVSSSLGTLPILSAVKTLTKSIEQWLQQQGFLEFRTRSPEKPTPAPTDVVQKNERPLVIHTDGGCLGNPGVGAWAYVITDGAEREEATDGEPLTTNNRMELRAVIEALSAISRRPEWAGRSIRVVTDSQYVRNGITVWIKSWVAKGWKTAANEPVKNQELWMELLAWDKRLHPEWTWVKGHAGNAGNERCDALVRRTMEQLG